MVKRQVITEKKRAKTRLMQKGNANITLVSPEGLKAISTATGGVKLFAS